MELIDEIYRDGIVSDAAGTRYPLHSAVDVEEGRFLSSLIHDNPDVRRTLEVGGAYGLSSLHIATALQGRLGAHHVIVDPFQNSDWGGVAVSNLRRAGVDFFELIEQPSETALPAMLADGTEPFDLVFIDGWHTFDHTLLDLFYATRLIRTGGFVVVDDCSWRSVSKALSYVANYPCFRVAGGSSPKGKRLYALRVAKLVKPFAGVLPRSLCDNYLNRAKFPTMVALQKIAEDERRFDWYQSF